MHQIHVLLFLLGLRPRPLSLFQGPTSKGIEGNGRGEVEEKVKGKEGRGGGRDLAHLKISVWRPL